MSTLRNIQFAGNTLKDSAEKTKNWLKSGNPISQIVLAILFIFVVIIIVNVVKNIFTELVTTNTVKYGLKEVVVSVQKQLLLYQANTYTVL